MDPQESLKYVTTVKSGKYVKQIIDRRSDVVLSWKTLENYVHVNRTSVSSPGGPPGARKVTRVAFRVYRAYVEDAHLGLRGEVRIFFAHSPLTNSSKNFALLS